MSQAIAERVAATPYQPERAVSLRRSLIAGALTGQAAGLIMAVVVMAVFTLFLGKGPLFPVQVIGSIVFGDAALKGFHAPAFLTGLVLHQLGPSLAWGLLLGMAARAFRVGARVGLGLAVLAVAIGLVSQAVDVNLVGARAFTLLHGHDIWSENVPAFWSWAAHLVFGLSLLLYPAIERLLED